PLAININIDEPWWRTTGLYSLLVIVISLLVIFNVVYYNKNYKIKVRKHNEEQEIWKRIKNFARRCDSYKYEILAPVTQETEGDNARVDLDERFVGIMLNIMPEVESGDFVSLHDLSLKCKLPVSEFCEIISANIYKNPRHLVVALRLKNSCEMLKDLDKSIAEISAECGFVSADYYRMVFEMMFGMTPEDYRSKIKG
ncbi:MAG: AraC family transcriptional regulator, partial [Prevotella sp.]|nr:AraC family transcriptional regulator [Prevotella sp.]